MLLVVTERGDLTADWLVLELKRRDVPFLRFNTEDYPQHVGLTWRPDRTELAFGGRCLALEDVDAVWWRRPVPPRMPADLPPAQAQWAAREAQEALMGAWRTLDAFWVNHPDRNRLAECKPEGLRTASALGFEVPPTLVTNDEDVLRDFVADHPGGVVCKPLWDGRVPSQPGEHKLFFTTLLESADAASDIGPEPYLFQALAPKRYDIRVTVIGDEAFAARIASQERQESTVDWRRARPGALEHEVEQLPTDVSERCVELCRYYGLAFGAIDLALRPDGGYTFFELNPNGQWAWVEQRTGLPLRSRLADLLLQPVLA